MFSSSISDMVAIENKTYKAVPCMKSSMQNKKDTASCRNEIEDFRETFKLWNQNSSAQFFFFFFKLRKFQVLRISLADMYEVPTLVTST